MKRFGRCIAVLTLTAVLMKYQPQAMAAPDRTISSSGSGAVQVVPDEVVMTFGVETTSKEIAQARKDNDDRTKAVIAACEKQGIERRYIQTDYLNIEPRYYTSGHERTFLGFWCTKTIVVRLKEVAKHEDLISQAIGAGANYIHGIEFRTTELRKHRDMARKMAIRAAREKAQDLAGELDLKVGAARTINETGSYSGMPSRFSVSNSNMTYQNSTFAAQTSPSQGGESSLAPGQINVTAEVSVTFDLETTGTLTASGH